MPELVIMTCMNLFSGANHASRPDILTPVAVFLGKKRSGEPFSFGVPSVCEKSDP